MDMDTVLNDGLAFEIIEQALFIAVRDAVGNDERKICEKIISLLNRAYEFRTNTKDTA